MVDLTSLHPRSESLIMKPIHLSTDLAHLCLWPLSLSFHHLPNSVADLDVLIALIRYLQTKEKVFPLPLGYLNPYHIFLCLEKLEYFTSCLKFKEEEIFVHC